MFLIFCGISIGLYLVIYCHCERQTEVMYEQQQEYKQQIAVMYEKQLEYEKEVALCEQKSVISKHWT